MSKAAAAQMGYKDDEFVLPRIEIQKGLYFGLRVGMTLRISFSRGTREARVAKIGDATKGQVWIETFNTGRGTWTNKRRLYPSEIMVLRSACTPDELSPEQRRKDAANA